MMMDEGENQKNIRIATRSYNKIDNCVRRPEHNGRHAKEN
jgi:hypothetical protein